MAACGAKKVFCLVAIAIVLGACEEQVPRKYISVGKTKVASCCNEDAPNCFCFVAKGDWDPPAGVIQEVALSTLGASSSCVENGGKPYYQMRLGLNSISDAQLFACVFENITSNIDTMFANRESWCSEAVSYWHREAEVPYPGGFRNNEWMFTWQLENADAVRLFYETEEASGGRGRWIDWFDLDYDNVQLGVNVPLPGSYVLISGYDATTEKWLGDDHSMLIDEMTVYMTQAGKVDRISVTIIEGDLAKLGNFAGAVTNTRVINDLIDATPFGDEILTGSKKIVGFGVDLNRAGLPIYDKSRYHEITVEYTHSNRVTLVVLANRDLECDEWESRYAIRVKKLVPFIENLRSVGGPIVTSSNEEIKVKGIPDNWDYRWVFSQNGEDFPGVDFEILIDLLDDHPIPIRDILLFWSGDVLPHGYRVRFASSDGEFKDAPVPDIDSSLMGFNSSGIAAVPVPVKLSSKGAKVRYIKLIFPAGSLHGVRALEEMRFEFELGK